MLVRLKAKTALLSFAKGVRMDVFQEMWNATEVMQLIPFSSKHKKMGMVAKGRLWKVQVICGGCEQNSDKPLHAPRCFITERKPVD